MLQQQPTAGIQVIWRLLKDPADVVQAVRSADQGLERLVGQGGEMGSPAAT